MLVVCCVLLFGFLEFAKQLEDGTQAPEEACAQPWSLLPSPSGYFPVFRCAMEVSCDAYDFCKLDSAEGTRDGRSLPVEGMPCLQVT